MGVVWYKCQFHHMTKNVLHFYFNCLDLRNAMVSLTCQHHVTLILLQMVLHDQKVMMWAVPEGQGEGMSWLHYHHWSDILSILHTCWLPNNLPPLQQIWLFTPLVQNPSQEQFCHVCGSLKHYTAMCRHKKTQQPIHNTPWWGDRSFRSARNPRHARLPGNSRTKCRGHHSSQSHGRQSHHCNPVHSQSCSTSHSPYHSVSPNWLDWSHCQHTPFQYLRTASK